MEIETEETSKHSKECKIEIAMTIDHTGVNTKMQSVACTNTLMVAIANLELLKLKFLKDLKEMQQNE